MPQIVHSAVHHSIRTSHPYACWPYHPNRSDVSWLNTDRAGSCLTLSSFSILSRCGVKVKRHDDHDRKRVAL